MQETYIISRTMYCEKCNGLGRPRKNDWFVVFGSTRKELIIKKAHHDGISGFTPHIIVWEAPLLIIDGKLSVVSYCGMHGCDTYVQDIGKKLEVHDIDFSPKAPVLITESELTALLNFKQTGYELI